MIGHRRTRVYVAGPISKGDLWGNVERGVDAGLRLLAAGYALADTAVIVHATFGRGHVAASSEPPPARLCPSCGLAVTVTEICPHHHVYAHDDEWAAGNRAMCDFFHRGVLPRRLSADDREDEAWTAIVSDPT